MFRWIGDIFKKVLINVITFIIIGGIIYFIIRKFIF
jgi:hypothetical protein